MPIHNADIATIFEEIADLLEIDGANPFRIRAYRNAARTLRELGQEVRNMIVRGEDLTELPTIGKDLAAKIQDIVATGTTPLLSWTTYASTCLRPSPSCCRFQASVRNASRPCIRNATSTRSSSCTGRPLTGVCVRFPVSVRRLSNTFSPLFAHALPSLTVSNSRPLRSMRRHLSTICNTHQP